MSKTFPTTPQRLKQLEAENAAYLEQQHEAISTIKQLTTERDTLHTTNSQLITKIKQLEADKHRLCEQIVDLNQEVVGLLKERDELRMQVALLYISLKNVRYILSESLQYVPDSNSELDPMFDMINHAMNKTPADAAQYVRGLEAAITEAIDKAEWANDNDLIVQQLRHALAAKEDRG